MLVAGGVMTHEMEFTQESVNSWKALTALYDTRFRTAPRHGLWMFRGHADSQWPLQSRLERRFAAVVARMVWKSEMAHSSGCCELANPKPAAGQGGHRRNAPW